MEAVLCIAIGACVKLRGNIDMASGLVDDAYGTVVEIKVHTIKATLDHMNDVSVTTVNPLTVDDV